MFAYKSKELDSGEHNSPHQLAPASYAPRKNTVDKSANAARQLETEDSEVIEMKKSRRNASREPMGCNAALSSVESGAAGLL